VAPERFEYLIDTFGGNGFSGVPDLEYQVMLIGMSGDFDGTFSTPVSQGIRYEIGCQLL
jgi:hypothetical protein